MISCSICNKKNIKLYGSFSCRDFDTIQKIKYYKCKDCEHLFMGEKLSKEIFEKYYNEKYKFGNYRDYNTYNDSKISGFDYLVSDMLKGSKKQNILEIGSGEGFFLKTLENFGYENLFGIEISKSAIENSEKLFGVKSNVQLKQGTIENINRYFPGQLFDYVIVLDVIEHLDNPIEFLKKIRLILNDKGKIVITTPRLNSIFAKILQHKWPYFLPLEHCNLFSVKSMSLAMKRAGFENIIIKKYKKYFDFKYVYSCLVQIYSLKGFFLNLLKSFIFCISKISDGVMIDIGLMIIKSQKGNSND